MHATWQNSQEVDVGSDIPRFEREELFRHDALRNCLRKLALTVRLYSVPGVSMCQVLLISNYISYLAQNSPNSSTSHVTPKKSLSSAGDLFHRSSGSATARQPSLLRLPVRGLHPSFLLFFYENIFFDRLDLFQPSRGGFKSILSYDFHQRKRGRAGDDDSPCTGRTLPAKSTFLSSTCSRGRAGGACDCWSPTYCACAAPRLCRPTRCSNLM